MISLHNYLKYLKITLKVLYLNSSEFPHTVLKAAGGYGPHLTSDVITEALVDPAATSHQQLRRISGPVSFWKNPFSEVGTGLFHLRNGPRPADGLKMIPFVFVFNSALASLFLINRVCV